MGLAEKRWVLERKQNDESKLVTELKQFAGPELSVEIDWEGFSANIGEAQYISHDSYGLPNLTKALKEICVDDLGKEAVKSGLKSVKITSATADAAKFTFAGGVITWNAYFGATSSGYVYADAMKKTIEAGL